MIVKRLFDICAALLGIFILSPILLIIALLIKTRMPGPILFLQHRIGKNAVIFKMFKFRTMKINHGGSSISVKGENRITPLGAILRKYKLDELPELWNVFRGDMSLVGPRPDVPGYADMLKGEDLLLLTFKPGVTGAASLKYSDEEELLALQKDPKKFNDVFLYPDKVRININYIKNWSFGLDIKIIFYTLLGKKMKEPWLN